MRPDFSKRLCGATYISQPMIGCTPCRRASSVNCTAPNMLPWSVIAQAGIPAAFTRGISSLILFAPSSSEYCVWRCRWTKDIAPVAVRHLALEDSARAAADRGVRAGGRVHNKEFRRHRAEEEGSVHPPA